MFVRDLLQPWHLITILLLLAIIATPIVLIIRLATRGSRTKKCPYCMLRIHRAATVCPHCQREQPV